LVIIKLACSLVGTTETITITPDTLTHQAYGKAEVTEQFACNYGLSPEYRERISHGDLKVTGVGPGGEVRIIELFAHRFFIATLFLPQVSSSLDDPHPLVVAFLKAAQDFRARRKRSETRI
jgi:CTP synthase (UTP-ammonia lyase)